MSPGDHAPKRLARIIVLATGALIGFFVWKTYFSYVPPLYPVAFTQGQWIVAPGESPQGYFRKEVYISEPIQQAWIQVAASDSFELYLNDQTMATQGPSLVNVSGVYDLGPSLRPGKNVIGVKVVSVRFPGPAKAVVEGAYLDQGEREHRFFSDAAWKGLSYEAWQVDATIPWYARAFNADTWPFVRTAGVPSVTEVSRVATHPALMMSMPRGQWIGHADPRLPEAVFSTTFTLAQKVQGAWLRVAADERYELVINGMRAVRDPATARDESVDKTLIRISAMGPEPVEKTLDIYDIGPFLARDTNTIAVRVVGRQQAPPRLLLDSLVAVAGQTHVLLATNAAWQTRHPEAVQWQPAVVLADYAPAIDRLVKNPTDVVLSVGYKSKQMAKMLACILMLLLMTWLVWLGSSYLHRLLRHNIALSSSLTMDALMHLPACLFLGAVYFLQYDIRYDAAWPFQEKFLHLAVGLLFLFKVGLLIEAWVYRLRPQATEEREPPLVSLAQKHCGLLLVLCMIPVLLAGLLLRLDSLKLPSLSHDETGMALLAKELSVRGYPVKTIGPIAKSLTTYELLPYPIAFSIALLGASDFTVRLPALVLGVATILLICYVGTQLWHAGVGILAAAIYACSPFAILWGSNAFHPQQTQFFALLASYLFYKSIATGAQEIKPKYLYGTSVCFIVAYLSWEGTGLLLPAFFICLLIARGKDYSWLQNGHLWLAVGVAGLVVYVQLSRRILENVPYIVIGKGLTGTTLSLFFLDPLYDPWFYMQNVLFSGYHILLTMLLIVGFPYVLTNSGMRYYCTLLLVLIGFLTNFLPNLSMRYSYFFQPFLLLPAAAMAMQAVISVWTLAMQRASWMTRGTQSLCIVAFLGALWLSTHTQVLRLYRLGSPAAWGEETLPGLGDVEYRLTDRFLQARMAPEDKVIALMPQTLEYYIGHKSDYYIQAYTSRHLFYDVSGISSSFLDKYIGSSVIRNIAELKEVLSKYRRVWIVAAPHGAFQLTMDKAIIDYISKYTNIVYENYKTRIYLWEK